MLKKCSNAIVHFLESFFYRLGYGVACRPWLTILGCIIGIILCVIGIPLFFSQEARQDKLWVASDAQSVEDKVLTEVYWPSRNRFSYMIAVAEDNILTRDRLLNFWEIDNAIKSISKAGEYSWETACQRIGPECWSFSILELWSFDENRISSLTQQEIIDDVNGITMSPVYGREINITAMLSGITRDSGGRIIKATGTKATYALKFNYTLKNGEEIDPVADGWEADFIAIGNQGHSYLDLYYYAYRSFGDEGGGAISKDVSLLAAGYFLVITFLCLTLGKFNMVQQRIYLSLGAVVCVGLAIGGSFGLSSYMQIFYGPLHSTLPFLLLGIGVDDAFVIVQSWEVKAAKRGDLPLPERIALTLQHAGVSISVTSFTDMLAFGIGATTIIPSLRSFCIYACIGIFLTFLLQTTLFVACLTIKQQLEIDHRDGCCCCYIHRDWTPNKCSQQPLLQTFFERFYASALQKLAIKILIIIIMLLALALGIYGSVSIKQNFDPVWFLPSDSYANKYFLATREMFPEGGLPTAVYMLNINHYEEFNNLLALHDRVSVDPYIAGGSVSSWVYSFNKWFNSSTDPAVQAKLNSDSLPSSEDYFYELLQIFLSPSEDGARFLKDLIFDDQNKLEASRIIMSHVTLQDASEEIKAMHSLHDKVAEFGYPIDKVFAYSYFYLQFESNEVIQLELIRNLGLAFVCVFLMTLLLIANLWTCILVALCVLLTVVDVMGLMYLLGLTIDIVTAINLIVAVGLSVDYAAHIGHTFMTVRGTRDERMTRTLADIAPAVFSGGFSTFLAFVLLAGSTSYVFRTFFKVFFSTVLLGVFHGLAVLPVVLSWIGPSPYDSASSNEVDKKDDLPVTDSKKSGTEPAGSNVNGTQIQTKSGITNPVMVAESTDENGLHKTVISVEY